MSAVTKKFITLVSILLVAVAAIIGCMYVLMVVNNGKGHSDSSSVNTTEVSAAQINKEVIEKMGYKDISELKGDDISGHFDIPKDCVTQSSIYISNSSSSATELACFKLEDPNNDTEIMAAISSRISTKLKGFQESPKESQYIKNYVTVTSNGYVFMVISENADVAGKTFLDTVDEKLGS